MSMQSTQSRKSWKSRSQLVEIDTVDFLFKRLICTCTCIGKFRIYTAARNSRPAPYQKVIKVYVQIPQILRFVLPLYSLYFVYWNRNPFDFFFFCNLFISFLFFHLLLILSLENYGKLSLFY